PSARILLPVLRYAELLRLHSLPPRRSSDLARSFRCWRRRTGATCTTCPTCRRRIPTRPGTGPARAAGRPSSTGGCSRRPARTPRSEEHTSELQSSYDLVCRLLLEKKNGTTV